MRKSGRKQRKNGKRMAALWLAGALMMSLAGCGNQSEEGKDGADGGVSGEVPDESVAMGRYVETMLDLDTGEILDLKELSDGKFALLENGTEGRWISEDGGATWKPDALPGWYDLAMGYYIYDMKAAPDGSVAILCKSYGTMSGSEDESEEENETEDSEESAAEDETEDSEESAAEDETEDSEESAAEDETEDSEESAAEDETEDSEESAAEDETEDSEESAAEDETEDSEESAAEDETEDSGESAAEDETEDSEESAAGDETEDSEEPAAEDETEDSGESVAEDETGDGESVNRICLIPAQGKTQWFDVPTGDYEMAASLCFSEDGSRLFVAALDQKIYEIDLDAGTAKLFLTAYITPDILCVWENYMALKNEREGVVLYYLDTMEQIEDDVITDFVKENCTVNSLVSESTYSIFPAEEEGIYLVCSKGVYRHVIGGTVMEQVINGGLSSFSDPMKHVVKMIRTAEEGFMAAFSEGKISSFSYDPNISTVPSQNLTAYSLTENDILRQAIVRYQGEHPDVYVEYRVGMDEEGAVTREDAVKKLNTEIMAGKGPDFLLLDGLPADSYVEKGVLADLTPYLTELEKEEKILSNIKESFMADGKICMIPAAMTVSMYMTDKENMTDVSDLSSLADMIEKLRSEHPGEGILETYSEDMILNALMPVSAPLWFEGGQLNVEEMTTYLEQTKRIYDACMEGLPEKLLQQYLEREQNWVHSSNEVSAYNDLQGGGLQIVAGNEKVALGELKNAYNYAFLKSVCKAEKGVNCQMALTPGSVKDAFRPYALMGINAASDKAELSGGLLREVLSKDMQSMIYPTGFPVNETGLQTYLETLGGQLADWAEPGEVFSGYGFSDESGLLISLNIYVPTEQETKELYELLSSVRTPYLADTVVEDAVREAGKWYLEDKCSLEAAVELVQEKIAIYMAE